MKFVLSGLMDWILRIKHYPVMRYCKYRNVVLIIRKKMSYIGQLSGLD